MIDVKECAIDTRSRLVVHIRPFKLLKTLYGYCFMLARKPTSINLERRKYSAGTGTLATAVLPPCTPVPVRARLYALLVYEVVVVLRPLLLVLLLCVCCTPACIPPRPLYTSARASQYYTIAYYYYYYSQYKQEITSH